MYFSFSSLAFASPTAVIPGAKNVRTSLNWTLGNSRLGNCGYGPAYCGTRCISKCKAKAECGRFAVTPGKTCQLNACCSEFGFCGTTIDFCKAGCQSNCVSEPKPPAGSPKNAALDRIVGYYETWSYRSKCNKKSPADLPLNELTHLNYAFAFIKPGTYELTTMDKETTEDLWQLTVDVKRYNPNLKVYVAVGGWTFSDNGTATQPLLGEISRTQANRQKFADGSPCTQSGIKEVKKRLQSA